MRLKLKNTSHRYDINRLRPRHEHKHTKYIMCLCIMMVICIKQQLSNIWRSIHEKFKQHWGWVEKKVSLIKKNACWTGLATAGAIQSISGEKIYQELSLELLQWRRWYRKLAMFYKIHNNKSLFNLFKLILEKTSFYATRNVDGILLIKIKRNFFKNTFFSSAIIEWHKLDHTIWNAKSLGIFKSNILKFIRPTQRNVF